MKEATEYIDQMERDSVKHGVSPEEWLEFLKDLRYEIETRIDVVQEEVKEKNM